MVTELEPIIQHINRGNYETAERELESFLLHNPKIIDAWLLLGHLSDNSARKAECYRQVLKIDPGNHRAEMRLAAVEKQMQGSPIEKPAPRKPNGPIRCPKCEAVMEIRHNGSKETGHAICVYCGTEVDLSDPYLGSPRRQTLQERLAANQNGDAKSRLNGKSHLKVNGSIPPELIELLEILKVSGPQGIDDQLIKQLHSAGINISFNLNAIDPEILLKLQNGEYDPAKEIRHTRSLKSVLLGLDEQNGSSHTQMLSGLGITINTSNSESTAADILALDLLASVGKPLSPDQSLKCPNPTCGAVIQKDAVRCSWCGQEF